MTSERARYILENPEEVAQRDRIILNNPVIFHALGIAPLVVVDTNATNALMMFTAVLFLLLPVRLLSTLLSSRMSGLWRSVSTCAIAAAVYVPAHFALSAIFQQSLLSLGIYLPMLICEPLIIQRFEHTPDTSLYGTFYKGVTFTLGYGLVLFLLGALRELLAMGTFFGNTVTAEGLFPLAAMPVGGFILLGLLAALWRSLVERFRKYVYMEANRSE